jgi:hypothetical protein
VGKLGNYMIVDKKCKHCVIMKNKLSPNTPQVIGRRMRKTTLMRFIPGFSIA